jgi:hypothetical protein
MAVLCCAAAPQHHQQEQPAAPRHHQQEQPAARRQGWKPGVPGRACSLTVWLYQYLAVGDELAQADAVRLDLIDPGGLLPVAEHSLEPQPLLQSYLGGDQAAHRYTGTGVVAKVLDAHLISIATAASQITPQAAIHSLSAIVGQSSQRPLCCCTMPRPPSSHTSHTSH